MKQSIAIVEDDADQRRYYADALRAEGYRVEEFEDREQAIAAFERQLPDIAILDIALKAEVGGGFEICRYLKQRDPKLPVLVLTSRGDELDKMYGLQLGAWDYQTKPVSLDYLLVRIGSLLRIREAGNDNDAGQAQPFADLRINKESMQCYWKDREISLTPTEFSMLLALLESAQVVTVDALISATRQGVVEENTISTHILHIRKKFKAVDADFNCIKTRYGLGYQWLCR